MKESSPEVSSDEEDLGLSVPDGREPGAVFLDSTCRADLYCCITET
jgi:hypothetical protein